MENKKIKALIAIILVITLTFADIFVFGMGVASYAVELISTTNHNNVQFSAYFITKEGEKVTEIEESMNAEDLKMYLEVSINNEGYFNGDIKLENSNFALKNEVSSGISKIEGNTITLNQITAGETIVAEVGITPIKSEEYGIDMLKAESKLTLEGTYLNGGKKT